MDLVPSGQTQLNAIIASGAYTAPSSITLTATGLVAAITCGSVLAQASTVEIATGSVVTKYISPDRLSYGQGIGKAWVVWTTSGGTVTIRDKYNVTSVTRNGAGDFSITFTSQFSTGYYGSYLSVQQEAANQTNTAMIHPTVVPTTGVFRLLTVSGNGNSADIPWVSAMFMGNIP